MGIALATNIVFPNGSRLGDINRLIPMAILRSLMKHFLIICAIASKLLRLTAQQMRWQQQGIAVVVIASSHTNWDALFFRTNAGF